MTIASRFFSYSGLIIAAACAFSLGLAAEDTHAMIVRSIIGDGQATVTSAEGKRHALENGAVLAKADVVETANVEVYIEVLPGVVATIEPHSRVEVGSLGSNDGDLHLTQGTIISQIDKNRSAKQTYRVGTPRGVAAARGTSFTVSIGEGAPLTITSTADRVEFTSPTLGTVMIQAGMISITPPGASVASAPIPLAQAAQTGGAAITQLVTQAVAAAATVVKNNIGSISSDSATNILAQVVAAASAAAPDQAANFTRTAVDAVTAGTSSTAGSATAAATITAAAITAAPTQAGAITAAAVQTAPTQSAIITAAAQQAAPTQKDAIATAVAAVTGQSTTTVQSNADVAAPAATNAVNDAKTATDQVVLPAAPATGSNPNGQQSGDTKPGTKTGTTSDSTPTNTVDPAISTSPAT